MIYLVTGRRIDYNIEDLENEGITFGKAKDFAKWIENYDGFLQVDTETPITSHIFGWAGYLKGKNKKFEFLLNEEGNRIPAERACLVAQFGDEKGETQWIFDVPSLNNLQIKNMCKGFTYRSNEKKKLIHNFLFDYSVVKWNFGIDMNGVIDTFMMSKAVTSGLEVGEDIPAGYNSLAGCASRYLGIDISKAAQTSFTGDVLTVEQIRYAAIDVTILGPIYPHLKAEVEKWGVQNVVTLESAVARSYGDAMCENLYLDPKEWKKNMAYQYEELARITQEFYDMMNEYFYDEIRESIQLKVSNPSYNENDSDSEEFIYKPIEPFVQKEDEYKFSWTGRKQKQDIMFYLYPEMPKNFSKKNEYQGYLDLISDMDDGPNPKYLNWILNNNFEPLELYLIGNHKKWLKENKIFIPKDSILINLNSSEQKLALFRLIDPKLKNTDKDTISKVKHPLAYKLKEYNKASKLATSYGNNFLDAINPDGMFRIQGFTQILNTGRSSMSLMQLLPGTAMYRNPFKPNHPETGVRDDGHVWKVVGADYASQELCVMATFAQEESMLDALINGYDLHSMNTAKLFPEKWAALGGEVPTKGKPEDKELLTLRNNTKATIFGIAYGKSAIGLGESLNIPGTTEDLIEENKEEFERYFEENEEDYRAYYMSTQSKKNTKRNKHDWIKAQHIAGKFLPDVVTGDDMIRRVFDSMPNLAKFLNDSSEEGVVNRVVRTPDVIQRTRRFAAPKFSSGENRIRRQAQNYKIQSSSANMTKYAICLIKNYIEENELQNKMKFCLPLHDEIRYIAREDFAEEALQIILDKMEEAGRIILGNDLQKSEGEITDVWEK